MSFRKSVACPALDLLPESFRSFRVEVRPVGARARNEILLQLLHSAHLGVLSDGLSESVGIGVAAAGHDPHHFIDLLLENHTAVGLVQRLSKGGMKHVGARPAVAAGDEPLHDMSL